jgi:hypothetical protein
VIDYEHRHYGKHQIEDQNQNEQRKGLGVKLGYYMDRATQWNRLNIGEGSDAEMQKYIMEN